MQQMSIDDNFFIIIDDDGGVYFNRDKQVVLVLTRQEMNDLVAVYNAHTWKKGISGERPSKAKQLDSFDGEKG